MALYDLLTGLFGKKKTLADLTEDDLKEKTHGVDFDRDELKAETESLKERIRESYEKALDAGEEMEDDDVIEIERLENKRDAAIGRYQRLTEDLMVLDELVEIQKDKRTNRITTDLKTIDLAKIKSAVDRAQSEGEMNREKLRELLDITASSRAVAAQRSPRQEDIKETIARARRLRQNGKTEEADKIIRSASRKPRKRAEAEEL